MGRRLGGDTIRMKATKTAPIELFNLAVDPAESTDVAAANPGIVKQIEKILANARSEAAIPTTDPRIWDKYKEDNLKLDTLLGWG